MSTSVSKIPVAKHRRLSPERQSPGSSPQKSVSKLPVRISKLESPVSGNYKENICDFRQENVRWNETPPVTSPSRIPVKNLGNETPRSNTSYRPQSIDLEDEFVPGKVYGGFGSPDFQQVRKKSDPKISTPQRKLSPLASQIPNSKIPIAQEYYTRTDRQRPSPPRSSSSSSLKMSPASERMYRSGSNKSLTRARSSEQLDESTNYHDPMQNLQHYYSEANQSSPPKPRRSSAPSPPKGFVPVVGWSLAPERQEDLTPRPASEPRTRIPKVSNNGDSKNDRRYSDSATEQAINNSKGKRQFEAFVMTGDRMINLAKTPAHGEFRSKYYKSSVGLITTSVPSSPIFDEEEFDELTSQAEKQVKTRPDPVHRRSFVRNSKSEDQLQMEPQDSDDLDLSSSVHTLHNGSSENAMASSRKSPTQNRKRSPPKQAFGQSGPGSTPTSESPDLSTSSLISCSEHYNGESVLDNISPKTPSSPDTPEWSLIDSFHKTKTVEILGGTNGKRMLSPLNDASSPLDNGSPQLTDSNSDSVTSSGNRVVITINNGNSSSQTNGSKNVISPGGSSTGTLTPDVKNFVNTQLSDDEEEFLDEMGESDGPTNNYYMNQAGLSLSPQSESEESDMESLRSYHPPVKVVDVPSAVRLAKRLYNLEGFKKSDVSRHLSRNNEFNQVVAEEYLKFFNFNNCSLDIALRQFLSRFTLTGETQERERVLLHFARRYVKCNPSAVGGQRSWFRSLDSVHTLTCAIMLLNTDLHGETLQRKMTCNEFIENLSELNDGKNFPKELLKGIYYAIKHEAIPWASDIEVLPPVAAEMPPAQPQKPARLSIQSTISPDGVMISQEEPSNPGSPTRVSPPPIPSSHPQNTSVPIALGKTPGGVNPFLNAPDPETAIDYKKGYVMRKSCIDPNGKKTKMGKRSWKMYFMTLRDMVLYCFKDEKSVRIPGAFDDLSQAIRIHHGLAVRADHRKKQFVFRLYTSDQAQYLFQTSDEKELLTWIDSINVVVASFSAPQLPAPCSSSVNRFQRPLMPSSKSQLTISDQLAAHESQLLQIRQELDLHQQDSLPKGAKGPAQHAYTEKEDFLSFETMRYETYILTLRTKNAHDA